MLVHSSLQDTSEEVKATAVFINQEMEMLAKCTL